MKYLFKTIMLGALLTSSHLCMATNNSVLVNGERDESEWVSSGNSYKTIRVSNGSINAPDTEEYDAYVGSVQASPDLESLALFGFSGDHSSEESDAIDRHL